jgi:hypothetical protein
MPAGHYLLASTIAEARTDHQARNRTSLLSSGGSLNRRRAGYVETQGKLRVEGHKLQSLINGRSYGSRKMGSPSTNTTGHKVQHAPLAAGAATVYRNYFAPIGGIEGQTEDRQFDGLADLGMTYINLRRDFGASDEDARKVGDVAANFANLAGNVLRRPNGSLHG